MLGIQLQVGDRKHAIRDRRFARGREREDMHTIYLAGSVSNMCVAGVIRAVVGADGSWRRKVNRIRATGFSLRAQETEKLRSERLKERRVRCGLQNCVSKRDLEQQNFDKGIFKLALLMQIRIMIRR